MPYKKFKVRKERRKFGLPIVISLGGGDIKLPARLNDVSAGGVSFKSNAVFPEGEILEILVPYPKSATSGKSHPTMDFEVEVIWSREYSDKDDKLIKYVHGCKFILPKSTKKIQDSIKSLIALSKELGERPLGF